jgi:hypothetical protein
MAAPPFDDIYKMSAIHVGYLSDTPPMEALRRMG